MIGQRGERFGRCGRAAGGRSQLPVRPGHVAQAAAGVAARLWQRGWGGGGAHRRPHQPLAARSAASATPAGAGALFCSSSSSTCWGQKGTKQNMQSPDL